LVFFGRYSVFFGICNTDVGIGIGILKYRDIGIGITDPGLVRSFKALDSRTAHAGSSFCWFSCSCEHAEHG